MKYPVSNTLEGMDPLVQELSSIFALLYTASYLEYSRKWIASPTHKKKKQNCKQPHMLVVLILRFSLGHMATWSSSDSRNYYYSS